MRIHLRWVVCGVLGLGLMACGRGAPAPAGPGSATAIKEDVKQLGKDIGEAGKQAAHDAKDAAIDVKDKAVPAIQTGATRVKDAVHDLAQTVADKTASTEPATQPR